MRKPILLVDDEPEILMILSFTLSREGHEIDRAENGLIALEKIRNNEYDAVVCDLIMPKLGGIGLIRKLRAEQNYTPFLFVSGHAGVEEELEVANFGAYDLIHKPNLELVSPALKKLLQVNTVDISRAQDEECVEFLKLLHDAKKEVA